MLGLLLAKRGAEVLVLEGHETFDRKFRGEVLQPSTARLQDETSAAGVYAGPASLTSFESGKVRLYLSEVTSTNHYERRLKSI
jgi:2-polyprenyl-6-methoxyphenol hydroxylase-like FAD-dependent oxidoreductase